MLSNEHQRLNIEIDQNSLIHFFFLLMERLDLETWLIKINYMYNIDHVFKINKKMDCYIYTVHFFIYF